MSCAADHAPKFPSDVRKAVHKIEASMASKQGKVDKKALQRLEQWFVEDSARDGVLPPRMGASMLATTQAVDIVNGGVKVNALVRSLRRGKVSLLTVQPEVVTAVVNHRISLESSVEELQSQLVHVAKPVVEKYKPRPRSLWQGRRSQGVPMRAVKPKAGKLIMSVAYNSS